MKGTFDSMTVRLLKRRLKYLAGDVEKANRAARKADKAYRATAAELDVELLADAKAREERTLVVSARGPKPREGREPRLPSRVSPNYNKQTALDSRPDHWTRSVEQRERTQVAQDLAEKVYRATHLGVDEDEPIG